MTSWAVGVDAILSRRQSALDRKRHSAAYGSEAIRLVLHFERSVNSCWLPSVSRVDEHLKTLQQRPLVVVNLVECPCEHGVDPCSAEDTLVR